MRPTLRHLTGAPASLPDPREPGVEVWRDTDGLVCALGDRLGEVWRLHLPAVATFEFELDGDEVRVRADPRATRATVVDQFYRTAVPLVLQARGLEVLHASAVRASAGVVALCATKESGKSTLACALDARGYALWADDAVTFAVGPDGIETMAVPFRLRLRPASAAHFGLRSGAANDPPDPGEWTLERAPLAAAVVLAREPGSSPITLRRLTSGDALTALLTHGYCFSLAEGERKAAMLRHYLGFVAAVPIYEFRYPTGLEHLGEMVDRLEREVMAPSRHEPS